MLQDSQTIRYYQKLTDAVVDLWHQGYRFDQLRLYLDGFIASLRLTESLETHKINRLEEEAFWFLRDPSNFEMSLPQAEPEREYYR